MINFGWYFMKEDVHSPGKASYRQSCLFRYHGIKFFGVFVHSYWLVSKFQHSRTCCCNAARKSQWNGIANGSPSKMTGGTYWFQGVIAIGQFCVGYQQCAYALRHFKLKAEFNPVCHCSRRGILYLANIRIEVSCVNASADYNQQAGCSSTKK